jgi:hypothetical protein
VVEKGGAFRYGKRCVGQLSLVLREMAEDFDIEAYLEAQVDVSPYPNPDLTYISPSRMQRKMNHQPQEMAMEIMNLKGKILPSHSLVGFEDR